METVIYVDASFPGTCFLELTNQLWSPTQIHNYRKKKKRKHKRNFYSYAAYLNLSLQRLNIVDDLI